MRSPINITSVLQIDLSINSKHTTVYFPCGLFTSFPLQDTPQQIAMPTIDNTTVVLEVVKQYSASIELKKVTLTNATSLANVEATDATYLS